MKTMMVMMTLLLVSGVVQAKEEYVTLSCGKRVPVSMLSHTAYTPPSATVKSKDSKSTGADGVTAKDKH